MSNKQINCPFCGNLIDSDAYKCQSCGELFTEPDLPGIKFKEFRYFVALLILTFGLFGIFWMIINANAINKLVINKKDSIKLNTIIVISLLDVGAYVFTLAKCSVTSILVPLLTIIQCLIFVALTYRVLKIIQRYTQKIYNVTLKFNPYYIVFFNILYLIHFIDTYSNRVLQIHEHFNAKSPQIIFVIILLLIIQFVLCWNTDVHNFYRWLFGI